MARTFLDEGTQVVCWKADDANLPDDLDAITTTEWATGTNISGQLVVDSSTFEFSDPATVSEKSWEDKGNSETPTTDSHNVELLMFGDRTDGALSNSDPRKVFKKREVWVFAVRPGVPEDTDAAAGQDYTYYRSIISVINDRPNPDGGTEKVHIKTLPRGLSGRGVIAAPAGGGGGGA